MLSKLKLITVFLLTLACSLSVYSQEPKAIMENDKQIVYKLAKYNIEDEKLIRNEFKNETKFRIVYVCQETGMIVFEAKDKITVSDKEKIFSKIKKSIGKAEFQEQSCTYKDAENNCILKSKNNL